MDEEPNYLYMYLHVPVKITIVLNVSGYYKLSQGNLFTFEFFDSEKQAH